MDSNKITSYIVMRILVSYCRNCHNDNYDEELDTNMRINVNIKLITIDEAVSILIEDSLKENIDKILWYLSNRKYSWRYIKNNYEFFRFSKRKIFM